ncbi:MAG TPA: hypothetical protein PKC91_08775 [Ignavibacteria bacterium]|nr:hypothetical protein [Ignavibacteria bacterium]
MTDKEHYDSHFGHFYSWMTGDFQTRCNEFRNFLTDNSILPSANKIAIVLGAGHGLQSIPIAKIGFLVLAVDFNKQLLDELKTNAKDLKIKAINDDIKKVEELAVNPELFVCCGDTLSNLANKPEIKTFISDISNSLDSKGKAILSFRDYSTRLSGTDRIIPVKSDNSIDLHS